MAIQSTLPPSGPVPIPSGFCTHQRFAHQPRRNTPGGQPLDKFSISPDSLLGGGRGNLRGSEMETIRDFDAKYACVFIMVVLHQKSGARLSYWALLLLGVMVGFSPPTLGPSSHAPPPFSPARVQDEAAIARVLRSLRADAAGANAGDFKWVAPNVCDKATPSDDHHTSLDTTQSPRRGLLGPRLLLLVVLRNSNSC